MILSPPCLRSFLHFNYMLLLLKIVLSLADFLMFLNAVSCKVAIALLANYHLNPL